MTRATATVDFRVGGRFRIVMHGEKDYEHTGKYLVIEPDKKLVFLMDLTFRFAGRSTDPRHGDVRTCRRARNAASVGA